MSTALNMVIVADREMDVEPVLSELRRAGFDPAWQQVADQVGFAEQLDQHPDLILADYALPGWNALEGLSLLRERVADVPLIVVADGIGEEAAAACIKQGAADYLPKNRLDGLGAVVSRVLADRRPAERQLRESQRVLSTLMSNLPGIAYRCWNDEQWTMEFISEGAYELTGYPSAALVMNREAAYVDLVHRDDRQRVDETVQAAVKQKQPFEMEYRIVARDGTVKCVWERGREVTLPDGRTVLEGFISDITERKRAERSLQESIAQFRLISEGALIGIYFVQDHQFKYINPAGASIFGYQIDEIRNLPHAEQLIHPDDRATVVESIERLAKEGLSEVRFTFRGLHKDGVEVYIEAVAGRMSYQGRPAIISNCIDITERKRAEDAERKQRALAEALADIAAALNRSLDMDTVLDCVLENVGQVADCDVAGLSVIEDDGLTRVIANTVKEGLGINAGVLEDLRLSVQQCRTLQAMLETEQPLVIRDFREFEGRIENPEMQWIRALVGAPIVAGDETIGFLVLLSGNAGQFTETEAARLKIFADQAAVAMQNARLFGETRQRAAYLAALNEASNRVSQRGLDLDGVLRATVSSLVQKMGMTYAQIWLVEPTGRELVLRASAGLGTDELMTKEERLSIAQSPGHLGHIARERQPLISNQVRGDERFDQAWLEQNGIAAFAGYPLVKSERFMAILSVFSKRPMDNAVLDLLGSFVHQVSTVIENAQLYLELESYSTVLEQAVEEATVQVRQNKERVEAILNNNPDPILLLGTNGTIQSANPAFQRLFSYGVDVMHNQPPTRLVKAGHQAALSEALGAVIERHKTQRLDLVAQASGGTTFDAEVALAPILQHEELLGVVCTIRDISGLKEVARMKDAFVSNVSHELRTPIASIKLNQELLARDPERHEVYMERLTREVERLTTIVEDLLRLSRLDQGRVPINRKPVDLNVLATEIVGDRCTLAESLGLELRVSTPRQLTIVQADEGLIEQVVSIFLTNAFNFTPAGGKVTLTTRQMARDGQTWVGCCVEDTGPGIVPAEQPYVFDRFYRGKAGWESGKPGTGLGLAIAREIIEQHGGLIEVASEGIAGSGAAFSIWLPVEEYHDQSDTR
jgi:PAS domain S-box-containing protein